MGGARATLEFGRHAAGTATAGTGAGGAVERAPAPPRYCRSGCGRATGSSRPWRRFPAARHRASTPWSGVAWWTPTWTATSIVFGKKRRGVRGGGPGGGPHRLPGRDRCSSGAVRLGRQERPSGRRRGRGSGGSAAGASPPCGTGWTSSRSPRRPSPWRRTCWWATPRGTTWRGGGRSPWCGWASRSMTGSAATAPCTSGYRGAQSLYRPDREHPPRGQTGGFGRGVRISVKRLPAVSGQPSAKSIPGSSPHADR